MIILNLKNYKKYSFVEVIKIIIHVLKIALLFGLNIRILTSTKNYNFKMSILKFKKISKAVFLISPETRYIPENIEKIIEFSVKVQEPHVVITDLIFEHQDSSKFYVHLPKMSFEVLKKYDFVSEVGIIVGVKNYDDIERYIDFNVENFRNVFEFKNSINSLNFKFPSKIVKKRHEIEIEGKELFGDYFPQRIKNNGNKDQLSIIILTTLNDINSIKQETLSITSLINSVMDLMINHSVDFEILLVIGPEVNEVNLENVKQEFPTIKILNDKQLFNFSRRANLGITTAKNDQIWLLNDDVLIRDDSSTFEDVQIAIELINYSTTGVVGTFLIQDGKINHAGIQFRGNVADHVLRGTEFSRIQCMNFFRVREVTGVTGANIFFSKKTINNMGAFDESFPMEYSDLELCLRANTLTLNNYIIRTLNFKHLESSTRKNSLGETNQISRIKAKYSMENNYDLYHMTIPYCCLANKSELKSKIKVEV
jgi:GT2 family glycosyltransferase